MDPSVVFETGGKPITSPRSRDGVAYRLLELEAVLSRSIVAPPMWMAPILLLQAQLASSHSPNAEMAKSFTPA
jgi:hypothetical protein